MRALVCGLGESLALIQGRKLPGVTTVGVNDCPFVPDVSLVLDRPGRFSESRRATIADNHADNQNTYTAYPHLWREVLGAWDVPLVPVKTWKYRHVRRPWTPPRPDASPITLPTCVTSPFAAVALAAVLGFDEIGLLGVDLGNHHLKRHLLRIDEAFGQLHEDLRTAGISLKNLSNVSSLSSLPFGSITSFLE